QDEWTAEAGADDDVGKAWAKHGEAVGALEADERLADRLDEIAVEVMGDEVSNDFRIGLATEDVALGLELLLEGGVVFDDAVMDDGDGAIAAYVRVGIGVGGAAVGRPARVADAVAARGRLLGKKSRQLRDSTRMLADVHPGTGHRGQARAIVAAVFQPLEPLDQDRLRLTPADVTDNSTHAGGSPLSMDVPAGQVRTDPALHAVCQSGTKPPAISRLALQLI